MHTVWTKFWREYFEERAKWCACQLHRIAPGEDVYKAHQKWLAKIGAEPGHCCHECHETGTEHT